jgi:hypothetical protein
MVNNIIVQQVNMSHLIVLTIEHRGQYDMKHNQAQSSNIAHNMTLRSTQFGNEYGYAQ